MVAHRKEFSVLERFKLELNMEKTSLQVDQKNMKEDMTRLTTLGLELRKQSQTLSEAQHTVVQERMKNEMLKNDIKEFHSEMTKTTGSTMDDASMQLHMAKKRHATAEMRMKLTRKSFSSKETKITSGTTNSAGWTTKEIQYPTYRDTGGGGAGAADADAPMQDYLKAPSVVKHELSAQRSTTASK